ncbi:uncharacterized protein BJ171DRAFT_512173 [Polychytrium aggregatum]|uniref:uncharacterized protein n=1 Tax=Polychytrium aggregatum TaxID=110093 RepID=UPI0022FE98E4|nr:uncharacterized protein BJ171DRAFT_512173 [Polychytrium aggregatum]KAI9202831.1 hypothetical protein BJ171DRAFT_512173 [Polychytrium aggregatum]
MNSLPANLPSPLAPADDQPPESSANYIPPTSIYQPHFFQPIQPLQHSPMSLAIPYPLPFLVSPVIAANPHPIHVQPIQPTFQHPMPFVMPQDTGSCSPVQFSDPPPPVIAQHPPAEAAPIADPDLLWRQAQSLLTQGIIPPGYRICRCFRCSEHPDGYMLQREGTYRSHRCRYGYPGKPPSDRTTKRASNKLDKKQGEDAEGPTSPTTHPHASVAPSHSRASPSDHSGSHADRRSLSPRRRSRSGHEMSAPNDEAGTASSPKPNGSADRLASEAAKGTHFASQ